MQIAAAPATTWTEILMTDHEMTERVFAAFERALSAPVPPSAAIVSDALEYFSGYVERCHNHKEEDHLFPLVEAAGVPRHGGPLAVMDRVRYFSHERGQKIFPRTRGAIGRAVQQCHPPKSVHRVNEILENFKSGERNVAEFWLDMRGRKIHVRYFAVRSPAGQYLGTLETVQDITDIQKIEGERRLLPEPHPAAH